MLNINPYDSMNNWKQCCTTELADAQRYYEKWQIDKMLEDIVISGGGVTSGEVQIMIDESISGVTEEVNELATVVSGQTEEILNRYTKEETNDAISSATSALAETIDNMHYQTSGDVQSAISGKADTTYVDQSVSGKLDTSTFETYSGSVDTALSEKADTSAVTQSINEAVSGKVDTSDFYAYSGSIETALSGKVDTTAYTAYTAATDTVLGNKADKSEIPAVSGYADAVKYNSTTKYVEFYHGTTAGTKVFEYDASPFLIDGMVQNVEIKSVEISGVATTCLVISFNTDAGKQDINIPISEIFDASNYYTKSEVDTELSGKADTTAVAEDISAAVSGKADKSKAYGSYQFGESSNQPYIRYKSVSSQNLGNEIYYAKINGKGTLTSNGTWAKNNLNFQLVETSAFTAYTASTDSRIAEDEEVTAAAFNEIEGRIAEDEEVTAAAFNEIEGRIAEDEEVTAAAFNALNEEISGKVETSAFTAYSATVETALSGKQDTLSAGTNITISGNVISAEGGGKAIEAGRGISITTGETADTVSFNLALSGGGNSNLSVVGGNNCTASNNYSFVFGNALEQKGGSSSVLFGYNCKSNGSYTFAGGWFSEAQKEGSFAYGQSVFAKNKYEHSVGQFNNSVSATTRFGDSGNTLFSVGNGTADNARHNAFEIRQNGDIYLSSGGTDIKLQDYLGGGSITVDTALDSGSTNPVENRVIYNKFDEVEQVTAAALNALNDTIGNINSILESI